MTSWKSTVAAAVLLFAAVAGCVSNLTEADRAALGSYSQAAAVQAADMTAEVASLRSQAAAAEAAAQEADLAGDTATAATERDRAKRLLGAARTLEGTAKVVGGAATAAAVLANPDLTDEQATGTLLQQAGALLPPPYNVLVPSGGLLVLAGYKAWQERKRLALVTKAIAQAGGPTGPQALALSKAMDQGTKRLVSKLTYGVEPSPEIIAGGAAMAAAVSGVKDATAAGAGG